MTNSTMQADSPTLGATVGGLLYMNNATGECTHDQSEVLEWVSNGVNATVYGYFTYEWNGLELKEVWHAAC